MKQRCTPDFHEICYTVFPNGLLQAEVREVQRDLLAGSHRDPVNTVTVVGVVVGEVWRSERTRVFCVVFQAYCEKEDAKTEKKENIMLHS